MTKTLIIPGDLQFNAVSASKKIMMNGMDLKDLADSYWYDMVRPCELAKLEAVEIRLVA